MTDRPLLPCPNCGAESWSGEDTTTDVELDFEFGGQQATQQVPAKVCPDCGEVFAL
jgi:YgiT-type zinc finger domain-containing protein